MLLATLLAFVVRQAPLPYWNLVCGGDIMLNGVSPSVQAFQGLEVPNDSVFYANLEIPLTNVPDRTPRKTPQELAARKQFVLKADPAHIQNLAASGIDVVSLGNNHAMDGTAAGLDQMLGLLDAAGIQHAGAGDNWEAAIKPAIVEAPNGLKIAFISYLSFLTPDALRKCTPATSTTAGIATLTLDGKSGDDELARLKAIVDKARQGADMVVVALHWGIERQPYPAAYQVSLGRLFIDAGADAVIGNHPHVLQPAELYKGKPILYSLGNLVNPGGGGAALYQLTYDGTQFQYATVLPTSYSSGKVAFSSRNDDATILAESMLLKKFPSDDSSQLLGAPK